MIKGNIIKQKNVPPGQLSGNDTAVQPVPKPSVENVETICLQSFYSPPMENFLLDILVDPEGFFIYICRCHIL